MNGITPDLDLQQRLVERSFLLLKIIAVISLLSFAGIAFSVDWLHSPAYGRIAMNPLTSLCFMALVIALHLKLKYRLQKGKHHLSNVITAIILVISFTKLLSVIGEWNYPLDQMMVKSELNNNAVGGIKNSMVPITAFCLSLLSAAILYFPKRQPFFLLLAQAAAVITLMIAVFSILGYIFGAQEFHDVANFIPMAFSSGICFFLLSIALLFAAPDAGFMQQLTSKYSGSYIAWRLIFPAIFFSLFLVFLCFCGE